MRFKLLDTHYIDDQLLEAGTEIGDGTSVPFTYPESAGPLAGQYREPSLQMEPLDDEAKAAVEKVQLKASGLFADLPLTLAPAGADPAVRTPDPVDPSKPKAK